MIIELFTTQGSVLFRSAATTVREALAEHITHNRDEWGRVDLAEIVLTGQDLRGMDLSSCDLWRAQIDGADLRECDLQHARLCEADLTDTDLEGANVWAATFIGAKVTISAEQRRKIRGAFGADFDDTVRQRWRNEFNRTSCSSRP